MAWSRHGSAFGHFCDTQSSQIILRSFDGLTQFTMVPASLHISFADENNEPQASESSSRFLAWNLRDSMEKRACPGYVNGYAGFDTSHRNAEQIALESMDSLAIASKTYEPARREMQQTVKPIKYVELLVRV